MSNGNNGNSHNEGDGLDAEIKRLKAQTGGDLLKLADSEMQIVKFDLNEKGKVVGRVIDREYDGKKSKAIMFPVTMVNSGERKQFPLAISWADDVVDLIQRKQNPLVEVRRRGTKTQTHYSFNTP